MALKNAANPFAKKMYLIVDWVSNDYGRVGVDLKWLKGLGIPVVRSVKDLPEGKDYKVVNTGYDAIVDEEIMLREQGVDIIDKPCPFIRRIRNILQEQDSDYQYILLCEPTHIIIKNFAALFPSDLILVQLENYQEKIMALGNHKPKRLVPYVTFLKSDAAEVFNFVRNYYPDLDHDYIETSCMWIKSKASPIVEIDQLGQHELVGIQDALLITTAGSTNKSLVSMEKSLAKRNLRVVQIGSFMEFLRYRRQHKHDKVLLVRSPIPNQAEAPIMAYIETGLLAALVSVLTQSNGYKRIYLTIAAKLLLLKNSIFTKQARKSAAAAGLLKEKYR